VNAFGVIGGLGPETTSKFYLELTRRFTGKSGYYPQILIDNVSFPKRLEEEIIQKCRNEQKMLPFLLRSVRNLNDGGAGFIVMPCNTLHIFIDKIRQESKIPVLSVIEETVKVVENKGYKKIGLLATSETINSELFSNYFQTVLPDKIEQNRISETVVKILRNQVIEADKRFIREIIEKLIRRGADAIVLGCTDLQFVVNPRDFDVEVIDTLEVLIDSSFKRMIRGDL